MTPLLTAQQDGIVTLTLNAPETRNAISDMAMIDALTAALAALNDDPSVRVAILTGAGSAFSSGGNVKAMAGNSGRAASSPLSNREWYRTGIQRIPRGFDALEVPVIAAVNGPAIGAGCDLACMCDLRIASENAVFAESFVKLGLIPGDGGAWLLPRIIGQARAREMAFTGDPITAAEALACGLVSQVVPPEDLLPAANRLAARIAANPPATVRLTKRLMREAERADLETVLQLSAAMQTIAHATEDHREAVEAFVAKRAPRFSGA